jgi:hypothetical protein
LLLLFDSSCGDLILNYQSLSFMLFLLSYIDRRLILEAFHNLFPQLNWNFQLIWRTDSISGATSSISIFILQDIWRWKCNSGVLQLHKTLEEMADLVIFLQSPNMETWILLLPEAVIWLSNFAKTFSFGLLIAIYFSVLCTPYALCLL